jgi:hypothetical protein
MVAGLLLAALCAPAPVWAQEETSEDVEVSEASEALPPAPAETHWYDEAERQGNIVFDLLIVRPLAGITAFAGAVLFVPAVLLTAPNGRDSMKEAYERFVREPGEYFAERPLGEF